MINYDVELDKIINNFKTNEVKPTLLLHSCCAPCSTTVLTKLMPAFDITVFYYNPCISELSEYEKRKAEQIKFINLLNSNNNANIKFLEIKHEPDTFFEAVVGLESLPEGGMRCYKCYFQRLNKTCEVALNKNFEYFGTTLSVSPYKHANWLNEIGEQLQNKKGIKFLFADFKKQDGYLKSINYSKEYNLYRQDYCGCIFSKTTKSNL